MPTQHREPKAALPHVALGELRGGRAMRSACDTALELPFSRKQMLAALGA